MTSTFWFITGSSNGYLLFQHHIITWNDGDILSFGPLVINSWASDSVKRQVMQVSSFHGDGNCYQNIVQKMSTIYSNQHVKEYVGHQWASYRIRKIAGCACAGNARNVPPLWQHLLNMSVILNRQPMFSAYVENWSSYYNEGSGLVK